MPFFRRKYPVDLSLTDAAGVVYFNEVLKMAHGTYELFLKKKKYSLKTLLSEGTALPIRKVAVDFRKPLFWEEEVEIHLFVSSLTEKTFETTYRFFKKKELAVEVVIRHVAIDGESRKLKELPEPLKRILREILSEEKI